MKRIVPTFVAIFICAYVFAQDPLRFEEEVGKITERYKNFEPSDDLILFTGSSSIRMWTDLAENFPDKNIINTGFGGSHTSDLIHYVDELVIKYNPSKIFIYEGDNDISGEKSPKKIMKDTKVLLNKIQEKLPDVAIFFISPKPSISRWKLKNEYETYNEMLKEFSKNEDNVDFVDVWNPMLDENGNLQQDLFIADNLHMNKKGYQIWTEVIQPYLK